MKYEKNTWNTYTWDETKSRGANLVASREVDAAITKAKMENIEDGIEEAHNRITEIQEPSKEDVGLGNVDNVQQASKSEHDQLATDFSTHQTDYEAFKTNIEEIRYVDEKIELKINGEWVVPKGV